MLALASLGLGTAAHAAELRTFNIPRKPLGPALIDLATAAGVTISTGAAARCAPQGQATMGRFTLEGALKHLLAGSGCTYRILSPNVVEIVVAVPSAPALHPIARPATPAQTVGELDELIVVATRRPTRADQLAYAVTSRDGSTLTAEGVHDNGDLEEISPSMTVTNLGPGRNKILLRGLSDGPLTGRTQSTVGIYLDEVRLTYNAPDPDLRLVDMAQVEILRGPQGALYGAGSLGGVLHLSTVQPDRRAASGWLLLEGATTRDGAGSNVVEGAVNLPFLKGAAAARLVGYRDESGGYIADTRLGLKAVNRSVRQGLRLAADLDLNERWTVSAGLVSQAINTADTQYAFAGQPAYSRDIALQEPHDNDFTEGHVGLSAGLSWADLKWTTAVVSHHLTSRYDATAAPPAPIGSGPAAVDDDNVIRAIVSEAILSSRPDAPVQWLAGLFFADSRQSEALKLSAPASQFVAYAERRREDLDEAALFGDAVFPLGDRFKLTLGGRLFTSNVRTRSAIAANPQGGSAPFSGKLSKAGFAPKIVLSYAPDPHWLAYGQASQGYRMGGFNTTGAPSQAFSSSGGSEPKRAYAGDQLWTVEAGVRLSALRDRLIVRASAFQATWKNIQSDELLASGFPFTANIGDGRNIGLEAEGRYTHGPLTVRADFLIDEPELRQPNPALAARVELALAGTPGVSGGVSARYIWTLAGGRNLELNGRVNYVGRSHLTFDAITSPAMGDYANSRLAAALSSERWRLSLAIDNLFDAQANTFAYGNPYSLRTTQQVTPLRPRTASITLRVSY